MTKSSLDDNRAVEVGLERLFEAVMSNGVGQVGIAALHFRRLEFAGST